MYQDLLTLVNSIERNIPVHAELYRENLTALTENCKNDFKQFDTNFKGVRIDTDSCSVFIRAKYRKSTVIVRIAGTGQESINYLFLISKLIENGLPRETPQSKKQIVNGVLSGEFSHSDCLSFEKKFGVEGIPCFVLVMKCEHSASDLVTLAESYSTNKVDLVAPLDEHIIAMVKFVSGDADVEFRSSAEYADVLRQAVYEETGNKVKVGIGGTVKRFADASISCAQATTAIKLAEKFEVKGNVFSYREFLFIKLLDDVPTSKLKEYLGALCDGNADAVFSDADMVGTADEFIRNNLNTSETSRNLFMHRNTLMYRLDKIERETGLNIRNFSDAVTFRLITIIKKVIAR